MAGSDRAPGLALSDSPVRMRPERDTDSDFLMALYATTRAEEMAQVAWSDDRASAFIAQQFRAQGAHYRQHYPGAEFLVVEYDDVPVGRLYLHDTPGELRLMDILLAPEWRGRGLGRRLLRAVVERALEQSRPVTLHVEPFNSARRWYERLGFELVEERGLYWFMRLPAEGLSAARRKLLGQASIRSRDLSGPPRVRKS